jgi:hypothetical protein
LEFFLFMRPASAHELMNTPEDSGTAALVSSSLHRFPTDQLMASTLPSSDTQVLEGGASSSDDVHRRVAPRSTDSDHKQAVLYPPSPFKVQVSPWYTRLTVA